MYGGKNFLSPQNVWRGTLKKTKSTKMYGEPPPKKLSPTKCMRAPIIFACVRVLSLCMVWIDSQSPCHLMPQCTPLAAQSMPEMTPIYPLFLGDLGNFRGPRSKNFLSPQNVWGKGENFLSPQNVWGQKFPKSPKCMGEG